MLQGNRPACSACSGWDVECVYASGAQTPLDYGFPTPDSTLAIDLGAFVQNIPVASFDFRPELSPPLTERNYGAVSYSGPPLESPMLVDSSRPSSANPLTYPLSPLPSLEQAIQLTCDFFERYHPQLPCIHKETFLDRLRGSQSPALSTPLEWAILATAARAHRDVTVSSRADVFLQTAVESLAQSSLLPVSVDTPHALFPYLRIAGICFARFAGSRMVYLFSLLFRADHESRCAVGTSILTRFSEWTG